MSKSRMQHPALLRLVPLVAALALGGCSFIPTYERPAAPVAPKFSAVASQAPAAAASTPVRQAADMEWQTFFKDARLKRLIELALQNNRDLRVAVLNIEQTRAQFQVRKADELPTVNAGIDCGQLVGLADLELRAGLLDVEHRYPKVPIVLQRQFDQALEARILEEGLPLHVCRLAYRCGCRSGGGLAGHCGELRCDRSRGALVGGDEAASAQCQCGNQGYKPQEGRVLHAGFTHVFPLRSGGHVPCRTGAGARCL